MTAHGDDGDDGGGGGMPDGVTRTRAVGKQKREEKKTGGATLPDNYILVLPIPLLPLFLSMLSVRGTSYCT